jgi:hypothetical protein
MDWRLIGALTSATLSCGLVAVAVTAFVVSGPGEPRKVPTSPTLLVESGAAKLTTDLRPMDYSEAHGKDSEPQPERLPGPDASPAPSTEPLGRPSAETGEEVMARRPSFSDHTKLASPSVQTRTEPVNGGKIKESADQYPPSESVARRPSFSDHTKLASPSAQTRTEPVNGGKIKESTDQYLPSESMARRPSPSVHTKQATPAVSPPLPAQPKIGLQEWRAIPTAQANLFNLGGHLDQSGLVDGMASPRLRDAFKKVKNYNKLPPEAKALIEEPNINLSKLAPYRGLLGMDDRKIEREQAVKFVRFASTRGIEVVVLPTSEEGDADLVLPPFN